MWTSRSAYSTVCAYCTHTQHLQHWQTSYTHNICPTVVSVWLSLWLVCAHSRHAHPFACLLSLSPSPAHAFMPSLSWSLSHSRLAFARFNLARSHADKCLIFLLAMWMTGRRNTKNSVARAAADKFFVARAYEKP